MPPPGRGGGFRTGGKGKPRAGGGERRSFGDRKPSGGGGFKKSFDRAPRGEGGFKKSFDRAPRGEGGFKQSFDRPPRGEGGFKSDRPAGGGFKKFGESGGYKTDRPAGGGFKKYEGRPASGGFKSDRPAPGGFKKKYAGDEGGGFKKYDRSGSKPEGAGFKRYEPRAGGKKPFDRGGGGGEGGGRPGFARNAAPPGQERIKKYDRPGTQREEPRGLTGVIPPTPANDGRWVYGVNPVLEVLRAHPDQVERLFLVEGLVGSSAAAEILSRAREAKLRVDNVERERLTSMVGGGVHQGVVAEVREYQYRELEDLLDLAKESGRPPLIVVLDGIQDPHNLGAIIRSAHSFGAHGVVIAQDRAAGVTGLVAKSSAGAIEYCPVARVVNISRALEQLKEAGCWTVAADPGSTQLAWQAKLDGPLVVVVGAEGPGLRDGVLDKCDFKVLIPMSGQVASLNASVSAGILLYEVSRQRALVSPSV
jgi:23S rRNA (guanosine2251-2'-O)-methyltransferase